MPELKDLSFALRTFLRAYRWRRLEPVPLTRRVKPLAECRVSLVSFAGLVPPGDEPFDEKIKGGDYSYRLIDARTEVQSLIEYHRSDSFDHAGIDDDKNVGMPLDRLWELADEGEIGEVAPRHVSLMGSITAPGRLVKNTLPEVAQHLLRDEVDLALLVPV